MTPRSRRGARNYSVFVAVQAQSQRLITTEEVRKLPDYSPQVPMQRNHIGIRNEGTCVQVGSKQGF